jgi:hypothetical protein
MVIDIPFIFRRPIYQMHKTKSEWDGLVSKTTEGFRLNLVLGKGKVVPVLN